jgi:hypothetical protein
VRGVETPLGVRQVARPSEGEAIVEQFAPQVGEAIDSATLLRALGVEARALGAGRVQVLGDPEPLE